MRSLIAFSVVTALCACGPTEEETKLSNTIDGLRAKRDGLKSEMAARELANELGKQNGKVLVLGMTAQDLQNAYQATLPIQFSASALSSYVDGTIIIDRLQDARVDGKTIHVTLSGKGQHIKLNVTPFGYEKQAKEMIEGVQSGITLKVSGHFSVEDGGSRVMFHGHCDGAELRKHNTREYQNLVRNGINQQLLNEPFPLDVPGVHVGNRTWRIKGFLPSQGRVVALFSP